MDFTAHAAAANGLDILLWLAFFYLAPHVLRFKPRLRAKQTRPQLRRLGSAVSTRAFLKTA